MNSYAMAEFFIFHRVESILGPNNMAKEFQKWYEIFFLESRAQKSTSNTLITHKIDNFTLKKRICAPSCFRLIIEISLGHNRKKQSTEK